MFIKDFKGVQCTILLQPSKYLHFGWCKIDLTFGNKGGTIRNHILYSTNTNKI